MNKMKTARNQELNAKKKQTVLQTIQKTTNGNLSGRDSDPPEATPFFNRHAGADKNREDFYGAYA